MAFFTVSFQMLALLIIIGAGYMIAKMGMMDDHTNTQMSGMIVNVFSPMLLFSSAANSVGLISMDKMKTVGLIAVGMFAFFIVVGMILTPFLDKDQEQRKFFQMMFVFSNLGFIGIPVVVSILGEEYVVYVTEFMLVYNVLFYTYGYAVMDGEFSVSSLKKMVNPGTVASVCGILVIIFGIQIPDFIKTAVTYLGNVTSPMALVAVGFSLAHTDLKKVFRQPRLYAFAVVKLLALPMLMLPVLKIAAGDASLVPVCLIMFGMPVGNTPLLLGVQKGMDGTTCSAAIILTTILCVITVPVLLVVGV